MINIHLYILQAGPQSYTEGPRIPLAGPQAPLACLKAPLAGPQSLNYLGKNRTRVLLIIGQIILSPFSSHSLLSSYCLVTWSDSSILGNDANIRDEAGKSDMKYCYSAKMD